MAGAELEAFWSLEELGLLHEHEYYLPSLAEKGHYTGRLQYARRPVKREQPIPPSSGGSGS